MQLIPKVLVVGAFVPPAMPGQEQVSSERLNRIWSELAPAHGFVQLQIAPDGSGAQFVGKTPDDGVTIQPPTVQVRATVETTADQAASGAQSALSTIAQHLKFDQVFNVGVRHVYHAPLPENDARAFVLNRLLASDRERLEELSAGSDDLWGGVQYVVPLRDRQYTLKIEPVVADQMKSLFIDLDAQFPGEGKINSVTRLAAEAKNYLTGPVQQYLDDLQELH